MVTNYLIGMENLLFSQAVISPNARYIDPVVYADEVWVNCSINIPELKDHYWVSNYGRLYSDKRGGMIICPNIESNGYCRITLITKDGREVRKSIHRIVMESFMWFQGCDQYQVNHIDGIKYHNWLSNLEWATSEQNIQHAYRNNLIPSGENASLAKYSNETVLKIADLLMKDYRYQDISMIVFGEYNEVYRHLISNIANKHCWNYLLVGYEFPVYRTHKQLLSDNKLDEIYRDHLENHNIKPHDLCKLHVPNFDQMSKSDKERYVRCVIGLVNKQAYDHIYSKYI